MDRKVRKISRQQKQYNLFYAAHCITILLVISTVVQVPLSKEPSKYVLMLKKRRLDKRSVCGGEGEREIIEQSERKL